jgi:hypothetical protein
VAQPGEVTIDGQNYGRVPSAAVSLPPGPHVVVVRNTAMRRVHTIHFDLAPGEQHDINVDFNTM